MLIQRKKYTHTFNLDSITHKYTETNQTILIKSSLNIIIYTFFFFSSFGLRSPQSPHTISKHNSYLSNIYFHKYTFHLSFISYYCIIFFFCFVSSTRTRHRTTNQARPFHFFLSLVPSRHTVNKNTKHINTCITHFLSFFLVSPCRHNTKATQQFLVTSKTLTMLPNITTQLTPSSLFPFSFVCHAHQNTLTQPLN